MIGTWAVQYTHDTKNPGTCKFQQQPVGSDTRTIQTAPTGLSLDGCNRVTQDGCTLVTDCHWPTSTGLIDIEQNSWTVQGNGISGTTDHTYEDPTSGQSCTYNENVTGTRQ